MSEKIRHLLASAIFDSEDTARLQEHPEALPEYLSRADAVLHHLSVLGATVCPLPSGDVAGLVERLRERYTADTVPPCRVCGGELSIQRAGGGEPTIWGCSPCEADPAHPGHLRPKAGRGLVDDHYGQSRWTQYRGGDSDVLEAADTIASLSSERERLRIENDERRQRLGDAAARPGLAGPEGPEPPSRLGPSGGIPIAGSTE